MQPVSVPLLPSLQPSFPFASFSFPCITLSTLCCLLHCVYRSHTDSQYPAPARLSLPISPISPLCFSPPPPSVFSYIYSLYLFLSLSLSTSHPLCFFLAYPSSLPIYPYITLLVSLSLHHVSVPSLPFASFSFPCITLSPYVSSSLYTSFLYTLYLSPAFPSLYISHSHTKFPLSLICTTLFLYTLYLYPALPTLPVPLWSLFPYIPILLCTLCLYPAIPSLPISHSPLYSSSPIYLSSYTPCICLLHFLLSLYPTLTLSFLFPYTPLFLYTLYLSPTLPSLPISHSHPKFPLPLYTSLLIHPVSVSCTFFSPCITLSPFLFPYTVYLPSYTPCICLLHFYLSLYPPPPYASSSPVSLSPCIRCPFRSLLSPCIPSFW
jgi:hypothetical protein